MEVTFLLKNKNAFPTLQNVWTVVSEKFFVGKKVCFALVFNSTQNDLSKKSLIKTVLHRIFRKTYSDFNVLLQLVGICALKRVKKTQ